jgi:hypothetical protein
MAVGRSASIVPNYLKGKASALHILELNERQSAIDFDGLTGVKLVRFKRTSSLLFIVDFAYSSRMS